MRVWWRSDSAWRVDKLLRHRGDRPGPRRRADHRSGATRATEAERSVDPDIRLPRTADLMPPRSARRLLARRRPATTSRRCPARRVAGRDGLGLRLAPGVAAVEHRPRRPVGGPRDRHPAAGRGVRRRATPRPRPHVGVPRRSTRATPDAEPDVDFTAAGRRRRALRRRARHRGRRQPVRAGHPARDPAGLARSPRADRAVGRLRRRLTQLLAIPCGAGRRAAARAAAHDARGPGRRRGDAWSRVGPLGVLLTGAERRRTARAGWSPARSPRTTLLAGGRRAGRRDPVPAIGQCP